MEDGIVREGRTGPDGMTKQEYNDWKAAGRSVPPLGSNTVAAGFGDFIIAALFAAIWAMFMMMFASFKAFGVIWRSRRR